MMNVDNDLEKISLDDLPMYSDWPEKLLSFDPINIKYKTESEVIREFEEEKWGDMLEHVKNIASPTLQDVDGIFEGPSDSRYPFFYQGNFYRASMKQMIEGHLCLYEDIIERHIDGASCLVELGAGYGSKLFQLAECDKFSGLPLIAGEFTNSGRELISMLAKSSKKHVDVGYCDFRSMKIEGINIPEDAIIFTSYAAHYVPELSLDFVSFLRELKPKAVIHFEPCYEHYSTTSLHGMLCRKYVEINDYTKNLVSVINAAEERNEIDVQIQKCVIGSNPFLPISVVEWAPQGRSLVINSGRG